MAPLIEKDAVETVGVSPKVKLPAIALGVIGVVLVAASYLVDGLEDLREYGIGLVIASPLGGLFGVAANPGRVVVRAPQQ